MTDAREKRRMNPPPSRPWVPPAVDAWYARLAHEAAALDPAALVARVETWVGHQERWTDDECINLNAATNVMSPRARALMGSTLGPRPSLGYAGDKYETGLADAERIEVVAAELARALFHAAFAEIRVLSGSLANLYAFMALARPGDAVMVVPESAAGHATHHAHGAAGLYGLAIHDIPFDPAGMNVDLDGMARRAKDIRPAVVLVGASLVLFPYDLAAVRRIADDVGARVMFDAAHVAGLIAGGAFPSPLDHGRTCSRCRRTSRLAGRPAALSSRTTPASPSGSTGSPIRVSPPTPISAGSRPSRSPKPTCWPTAPPMRAAVWRTRRRWRPRSTPRASRCWENA